MYVVACDSEVSICGYRIDVRILICRRIAARTGKLGFLLRLICTDQGLVSRAREYARVYMNACMGRWLIF